MKNNERQEPKVRQPRDGLFWASADGRVFGSCGDSGGQPNGVRCFVLEGGKYRKYDQHQGASYVQPGPDGKYIYTCGHGVLSSSVEKTSDAVFSSFNGNVAYTFLPAHHGPFYLHAHFATNRFGGDRNQLNRDDPDLGATIYLLGNREPLLQVKAPDITPYDNWERRSGMGVDRLIHLIPRAKLLVVVAPGRERLALYPVDLDAALDKLKGDYLIVTSDPPGTASPGKQLRYTMTARSSGSVNYRLDSGPEGMKVSLDGQLTWDVPATFDAPSADAIVRLRSDKGAQTFHTFNLTVAKGGSR